MNMKELTLLNFSEVYPDEETCVKPCAAFARIIVLAAAVAVVRTSIGTRRTSLGYAAAAVMRPRSVPAL